MSLHLYVNYGRSQHTWGPRMMAYDGCSLCRGADRSSARPAGSISQPSIHIAVIYDTVEDPEGGGTHKLITGILRRVDSSFVIEYDNGSERTVTAGDVATLLRRGQEGALTDLLLRERGVEVDKPSHAPLRYSIQSLL